MTRMKIDRNKVTSPEFGRSILDVCRDNYDGMPLVDLAMKLLPCNLQELPYLRIVLIHLDFIARLIVSDCTSLLLPNLDHLL